jgi:hypothetical protein
MALVDVLKGKQYKQEVADLKVLLEKKTSEQNQIELLSKEIQVQYMEEIKDLKVHLEKTLKKNNELLLLLTPEILDIQKRKETVLKLENCEFELKEKINSLQLTKIEIETEIEKLNNKIKGLNEEIIQLDDEILYQSFGFYTPIYKLMTSEAYKEKILVNRKTQKEMIKTDSVCTYSQNMTYNESLVRGQKMVRDTVKLVIRAFNNECDAAISGAKFNNIESLETRIRRSKESLEKLNKNMEIIITDAFFDLKIEELKLCHEYAIKKQEEKERARDQREALREEAKLQKEIEEARLSIFKEKSHYTNALKKVEKQMLESPIENLALIQKKYELVSKLSEIEQAISNIDYREANKRAGYVYIISNIGSFGENIYKIGMTRRLEPLDRINELGDASVPFKFDIHAMIFSDDAPTLESAIHNAFEHKKVNMINQRREFFHVTLDEIEEVIKANFDKTVDFIKTPEAEQFRESQMIKKRLM